MQTSNKTPGVTTYVSGTLGGYPPSPELQCLGPLTERVKFANMAL